MTWKAFFGCAALGALFVFETDWLVQDPETAVLEAELTGTQVAGRIPSGTARFERSADAALAQLEVVSLDLPHGTELESWLNDHANRPCQGQPLGTADLGPDGRAAWQLSSGEATRPETAAGTFISICTGDTPLVSGNLRSTASARVPIRLAG